MWKYSQKVMEYFLNPKNIGEIENPDGIGEVGNASCGDALRLTFKLDENGRIADVKFKTFGCVSAIASSSALTELIKGMTIEEALQVTNQDIVKLLGSLPEEKMHCSVMGMEALQAAIANYRNEPNPFQKDDDDDGRIVCHCFGVTDVKIRKVARENNLRTAEEVTNYCKAGGACGACLDDIQNVLDELWRNGPVPAPDFVNLPVGQRVARVQEIIDREIKPLLERDGGGIELVDLQGTRVVVRLQGHCASCPAAGATLKHTVEDKLREFVSPELTVENVR